MATLTGSTGSPHTVHSRPVACLDPSKPGTPYVKISLPLATMLLLLSASAAGAQETRQLTATDYSRAEQFMAWNTQKLTTGIQVNPQWVDGSRFWYRNRVQDGHEFVLVDVPARQRRPAFDHDRLAAALSIAADTAYEGGQLPFTTFEFADEGRAIRFHLADSVRWTCDINAYVCPTMGSVPAPPRGEVRSPDGERAVFVRDENLWLRQGEAGDESQLTTDGEEHFGYGVTPEGCCQEISNRRAGVTLAPTARWSPDGRRVATHRYDERDVADFHLIETALGRPKLHSYRYALPGDSIIPTWEIHLFDVDSGTSVRVDEDPLPGDFASADSAWTGVRWSPDGSRLYYTKRPRDFTSVELRVADFETGDTRTILSESGSTLRETTLFIGGPPNWRLLNGGDQILWFSERDGWGHLYRFDGATGELLNRVTEGPWLVMDVLHVDETAGWVYFTAMGREPDRDPYFRHLYRARLQGGNIQLLSTEDADHAVSVSPDGDYFVDQYSRRDMAPVTVVRGADGTVLQTVEEADIAPLLETGWRPPTPFRAKGRDGVTDVYGYLYFPSTFDPENDPPGSYPVVDYIYPGPQIGPNGFRGFSLGGWAGQHSLPELGFIVFVVDAMGTPWRSKAFHDAYYGDMGDNGIPDHISALQELALSYPQMDLDRGRHLRPLGRRVFVHRCHAPLSQVLQGGRVGSGESRQSLLSPCLGRALHGAHGSRGWGRPRDPVQSGVGREPGRQASPLLRYPRRQRPPEQYAASDPGAATPQQGLRPHRPTQPQPRTCGGSVRHPPGLGLLCGASAGWDPARRVRAEGAARGVRERARGLPACRWPRSLSPSPSRVASDAAAASGVPRRSC